MQNELFISISHWCTYFESNSAVFFTSGRICALSTDRVFHPPSFHAPDPKIPESDIVLIQPVDNHDLEEVENEFTTISDNCDRNFRLIADRIDNWNNELLSWEAPAVFGKEGFGSGASKTLRELLDLCGDKSRTYYIGGYSHTGLFALWTAYQTDIFNVVAAASPSLWFPGFAE